MLLTAGIASGGLALAYGGVALRLNAKPRRYQDLTDDHLAEISKTISEAPPPRVLVVGNSATIESNFFAHLLTAAEAFEPHVTMVRASAGAARLIETVRISPFRRLLRDNDWNAVVLQDFSTMPLRARDRLGSLVAVEAISRMVSPASIVLFPHWPSAPGHPIYGKRAWFGAAHASSLADYASKIRAHYSFVAKTTDAVVAPVLDQWLTALSSGAQLYQADLHHANETGAKLAANAVWQAMSDVLQAQRQRFE